MKYMNLLQRFYAIAFILFIATSLSACSSSPSEQDSSTENEPAVQPFASTYSAKQPQPVLIKNVSILDGTGALLKNSDVVFVDGKITQIGQNLPQSQDYEVIDGAGKWLTPGIIDVHSHMGVYPNPSIQSHADGNEMVSPNTAGVWVEHSVWPQDPNFEKAIAGGVTTVQILPGSANLFGGRGVVLKNVPAITMMEMKFPNAPHSLKMACGENPKRVYGEKGGPATRMGNMAGYRAAWIEAKEYLKSWEEYEKKGGVAPRRDLRLETLAGVLKGDIRIHNHCYRADEMANMLELANEFDYEIAAFHHAVEGYKVAPLLADKGVCAVMWADWWGFKQEAFDMVRENIALVDMANACAILHSDDPVQIQRLPQEAAKVIGAAVAVDVKIDKADAIKWLTLNAAQSLGLQDEIGSIEVGKNADIVLWNGDPFSVYSKADLVWIDGVLRFDRKDASVRPTSDMNIGILQEVENRP